MAVDLDLTLETEEALREMAALTHTRAPLAIKRAVRKTLQWLQREMLRELARASGISPAVLKKYRRVAIKAGEQQGTVWAGLNPLPAHEAGKVSWSPGSAGATAGGEFYEGAFYRSVYGTGAKVWVRTRRNASAGNPIYHGRGRYKPFSGQVSRGRFPVELVGMQMEQYSSEIADRIQEGARARFETILRQELNYVINHERN